MGAHSESAASVGENIRLFRDKRSLTQERLAELAGIHRISLSLIESGRQRPSLDTATAIARVLEVSVDDLLQAPVTPNNRRRGRRQ